MALSESLYLFHIYQGILSTQRLWGTQFIKRVWPIIKSYRPLQKQKCSISFPNYFSYTSNSHTKKWEGSIWSADINNQTLSQRSIPLKKLWLHCHWWKTSQCKPAPACDSCSITLTTKPHESTSGEVMQVHQGNHKLWKVGANRPSLP